MSTVDSRNGIAFDILRGEKEDEILGFSLNPGDSTKGQEICQMLWESARSDSSCECKFSLTASNYQIALRAIRNVDGVITAPAYCDFVVQPDQLLALRQKASQLRGYVILPESSEPDAKISIIFRATEPA